jgi:hypothetical protein
VPFESPKDLLAQLGGLLKYAFYHKDGMVTASELAALTGQTDQMIRACLKWFNGHTEFSVKPFSEDQYQVSSNHASAQAADSVHAERVQAIAKETKEYRRYWRTLTFSGLPTLDDFKT